MDEYHKINSLYKRDERGRMQFGEYADPAFEYLAQNQWVFTEKVDGTNIRVACDGNEVKFGGRTDNAQMQVSLLTVLQAMFPVEKLAEVFPDAIVCLYREGYGAKIQKGGGNYRPDQSFVLFDVRVGAWWLHRFDVEDVARKLGIEVVPVVGGGTLSDLETRVRDGLVSAWGTFHAEGIVARPATELCNRSGHRLITKLKEKDFAR